jgi:type II secretory pathway predicted ATPase ExeA
MGQIPPYPDAYVAGHDEKSSGKEHLIELRGIGLMTGEVGSGETTACRQLAAFLFAGLYRLLYVTLSARSRPFDPD